MPGENTGRLTATDGRYRALLDVSSAIAEQPTVKAVLHSLRGVLSSTTRLHGAELYVLDDDQDSLQVFEFDRDAMRHRSRLEPRLAVTKLVTPHAKTYPDRFEASHGGAGERPLAGERSRAGKLHRALRHLH
jgi:hypothetical protein